MLKLNIRRANENDLNGVNSLLRQVLNVHSDIRPDLFIPNTKKYSDEELIGIFKNDSTPVFVCTDSDGKVKGYAFCVLKDYSRSQNMTPIKSIYIDDLCVDETCRGEHIGTALYDYVKKFAKEIGCYNVTLNVWEGNDAARKFYDSRHMKVQRTTMEEIL